MGSGAEGLWVTVTVSLLCPVSLHQKSKSREGKASSSREPGSSCLISAQKAMQGCRVAVPCKALPCLYQAPAVCCLPERVDRSLGVACGRSSQQGGRWALHSTGQATGIRRQEPGSLVPREEGDHRSVEEGNGEGERPWWQGPGSLGLGE